MYSLPIRFTKLDTPLWIDGYSPAYDRSHATAYTATAVTAGDKKFGGQEMVFNGTTSKIVCGARGNIKSIAFFVKPTNENESVIDLDGGTHTVTIANGAITATGWTSPTIYVNNFHHYGGKGGMQLGEWNYVCITTDTAIDCTAVIIGLVGATYFTGSLCNIRFFNKPLVETDAGYMAKDAPIPSTVLKSLLDLGGLTFYKDYTISDTLAADFSVGDPTATFTRDSTGVGTSPGTYIDASGVVTSMAATDNLPRFYGQEYGTAGAITAQGLIIEQLKTNRALFSNSPENAVWTKTNITADDDDGGVDGPDGVAAASLIASDANGTFVQAYPITGDSATYTASVWLKRKTGTGAINLGAVEDGTDKVEIPVSTTWARYSVAATTDGDDAGKDPAFYLELETDTDAVYIYGPQLEAGPYMTSYIPVALGTAATRGAEILKYPISGNRTAAQETIVIKFMPLGGSFANDGVARNLLGNDTKRRPIRKDTTSTKLSFYPNSSDSSSSAVTGTTVCLVNTIYVETAIAYGTDSETNVELYINGVSEKTDADNYTAPSWGNYFYVGCDDSTGKETNGLIQKVAFFNRPLSATEVLAVYNLM